jgi:tetratricopeptide (TPR) repeat protein
MFSREKCSIVLCVLILILSILSISPIILAQDETNDAKVIERYKLMLSQKPKEGSTFDRLYQFYLDGTGLAAMVTDYQAEAQAKPNDPNIQLILGHIYKRLGKDKEALAAYQRAVALAQNDYYAHFALGQFYVVMRQHEDAISELTNAATLSEQTQTISPEELTDIYKTLGHAYFSRDKLEEAIKAWEKISELDPQNIFARIELADLFREQELYPQAIAQHQAIIDIKKDDAYRKCLSLREIGKIHEGTGAYDKARQHYDEALNLTAPGNWLRKDLQHRIIAIYSVDANWKGLITYYQGKIETNPNDPEMLGLLASAYIENQQLDEGINTYKKGLELAPTDTGLRLSLIDALRNSEMSEDAASEYEKLSEQQPDDFGIYRELGKLYVQLENVDKAKAIYQKMIDRDPKNASTYLTLAAIYTGHEWLDDAVAAYQKAISLAPENLDYIEYFGGFYFRQANREKAVETWNQMVSDEKRTAENYNRLARLLETKTFPTEAIEASRKAVELAPDAYRFREALAKRLMNRKQYDEALLEYTEAVKLAPNDFFAEQMDDQRIELYRRQGTLVEKIEALESELEESELTDTDKFTNLKRLAKMLLKSGNTTYALEILLKARELQPDDVTINRWTAEVYVKQGRRDDAINLYTHLTDIDDPNAREYYSNIANAYLKVMDLEKATEAAKQVIAHSPRNPEGHQLLAQIARQSGDYESATDSFKQAIRLRPEAIDIRTELAAVHDLAGNSRQAIAQYWRCWELSDGVNDKLIFVKPLSETYYDLGRSGEFEEKLKQLSKSNTSGAAPVLALAELYRMEGDLPSARFQLARALDRERKDPDLLATR